MCKKINLCLPRNVKIRASSGISSVWGISLRMAKNVAPAHFCGPSTTQKRLSACMSAASAWDATSTRGERMTMSANSLALMQHATLITATFRVLEWIGPLLLRIKVLLLCFRHWDHLPFVWHAPHDQWRMWVGAHSVALCVALVL